MRVVKAYADGGHCPRGCVGISLSSIKMICESLPFVKAPTLLMVGHLHTEVVMLNQRAFASLNCEKKLEVIVGATHLFEEKGTMEKVCVLAANWFEMHLQPLELYR